MAGAGSAYPGTDQHRAVLRSIVELYRDDARVRAVAVFGSVGRGDWQPDSDLDLDIVVTDEIHVDAERELTRVCASLAALGEQPALIIPYRADEGDVVFESLLQLSIRYHPLATTNPNILDGLRVLGGALGQRDVEAAARSNLRPTSERPALTTICACLNCAVTAERALRLKKRWLAIELIHQARGLLIELFCRHRGGVRPIHTFDAQAPPELQILLGATLPIDDVASIRVALERLLDLLDRRVEAFAGPGVMLTGGQRAVLRQLRMRLSIATPTE